VRLIAFAARRNWNGGLDGTEPFLEQRDSGSGSYHPNRNVRSLGRRGGPIQVQAILGVVTRLAMAEAEHRFIDEDGLQGDFVKPHAASSSS
jgi:hypothetical protein